MKSPRPRSGKKEVQQLLDEFYEAGWTITPTGSGHWKLVTPNGLASGFCAATPSDHRAFQNIRTDLKKVLRLSEERAANYQPPTPPEVKAYRHAKDEKNMQSLTHNPFATIRPQGQKEIGFAPPRALHVAGQRPHSIPKPLPDPIPRSEPAFTLSRPDLNLQTARKRMQELMSEGKSAEDAVTVILATFRVITGYGSEVSREKLIELGDKPFNLANRGSNEPEAKEAKVTKEEKKPVRKPHTDKEIDEKLAHVRSILTLPFDKEKKLSLIIDLLNDLL